MFEENPELHQLIVFVFNLVFVASRASCEEFGQRLVNVCESSLFLLFLDCDEGAWFGYLQDGKAWHVKLIEINIFLQFPLRCVNEELAKVLNHPMLDC